jgi:GH43 family beta-xylosidase
MSYTLIQDEGIVIRDEDDVQVAPAQSATDKDFVAYILWVNQGNEPTILETRG